MFKKASLYLVLVHLTIDSVLAETGDGVKVYSIEDYLTYILGLAFIVVGIAIIAASLRE